MIEFGFLEVEGGFVGDSWLTYWGFLYESLLIEGGFLEVEGGFVWESWLTEVFFWMNPG